MIPLVFKLIIPLTIISFWAIGKWWYVLPEDSPDTMYTGFPFIYSGPGWHTSLSFQIFITEFILDLLIYFMFWFTIVFLMVRFNPKFKVANIVAVVLWVFAFILPINQMFLLVVSDNAYYIKRPYKIKVLETGIDFGWKFPERPDYYKYFPENR